MQSSSTSWHSLTFETVGQARSSPRPSTQKIARQASLLGQRLPGGEPGALGHGRRAGVEAFRKGCFRDIKPVLDTIRLMTPNCQCRAGDRLHSRLLLPSHFLCCSLLRANGGDIIKGRSSAIGACCLHIWGAERCKGS